MSCPSTCTSNSYTCLSGVTFSGYVDNVANPASYTQPVLYASGTQHLAVVDSSWPTSSEASFSSYTDGTYTTYIKVLPLGSGCCAGAAESSTYASPDYGGAAAYDSAAGIFSVPLNLGVGTYRICAAMNAAGPPFADTDYSLLSTAQLQVYANLPPPPPLSPDPIAPPPNPPSPTSPPPPSPSPRPPPAPPSPILEPVLGRIGLDRCLTSPPVEITLGPVPPDMPAHPPFPPAGPPPPPGEPPPAPIWPGYYQAPPPMAPPSDLNCYTLGQVLLHAGLAIAIPLIICCILVCKGRMERAGCGGAAMSAITAIPKNQALDNSGSSFKIGGSAKNTSAGRVFIHTCVALCLAITIAILVAVFFVVLDLLGRMNDGEEFLRPPLPPGSPPGAPPGAPWSMPPTAGGGGGGGK